MASTKQIGSNEGDRMALLSGEFSTALGRIEPGADKENAPEAHQLVRSVLESDATLAEYGIKSVLIGSYKRRVSIRRVKDVDVFCMLEELPVGVTSKEILDKFFEVLHGAFGRDSSGHQRTKRQDRSLQVDFPEFDLYVDAVPARPHWDKNSWEIPKRGQDNDWQQTNPDLLTSLTQQMNDAHAAMYVPTVKLLRQTRRALMGHSKPGGFFIEIATYQAFASGAVVGQNQADYYASALAVVAKLIKNHVDYGLSIGDPTLPGLPLSVRAKTEEFERLKTTFAGASESAARALAEEDRGKAALGFRNLLGVNGDGEEVFPMPAGYEEDGTKKERLIVPGDAHVPAGSRNFG
ncbi:nucleotidyltransferase domain-containing protein [Arthrobacter sp. FW306-2-2C-D06B]|uniref:nucleotidyltransferase domain-containing protein n=1 Tax=Arthrobacter sp. FW306-2-2C-D06B TaxID=2879618 RepID=UPI001F22D0C3|nr:nucleotidyltransferase [Arthrobacter sp. FW306-2-2C-D06B]UKA58238.1 nucleotidyltransferase [Arthrobacter sp. FW306-2-2C-D06B]